MLLGLVNELLGALGTGRGLLLLHYLWWPPHPPRGRRETLQGGQGRKGVVACRRKSQAPGGHWPAGWEEVMLTQLADWTQLCLGVT